MNEYTVAKTFRRLGLADLVMLVNTKNDADALDFYQVDEDSARLYLAGSDNFFFACVENDRIIAYACGYELDRLDNAGNMLYVHAVGVHAEYRRLGIGKQMMTEIKRWCKVSSIGKMFLSTRKTNAAARALYDSVGGRVLRGDDVTYFFNELN